MNYRLERLFNSTSGNCINVAIDHGISGEHELLDGIEDHARSVDIVASAGPDAVQLSVGAAHLLQSRPGAQKPALVLRTDFSNIYGQTIPSVRFCTVMEEAVEQAVRLDAASVVANLFDVPDAPEIRMQCVTNILRLRAECSRVGMPLMVEPLVFQRDRLGPYGSDGTTSKIVALVRQANELGADVIKADPTTDLEDYGLVTQVSTAPVLVRGGGRASDEEILVRTETVLSLGARGIVYGRNIVQHENPAGMVRALKHIVHDGGNALSGARILESSNA